MSLCGAILIGFSGCASMKESLTNVPNPFEDPASREPASVSAAWAPASRVVDGVPERGFAGKVFFLNAKTEKGVKIDGDLIVFAYDEYPGRSVNDAAADKQYPYLAEDLKGLVSKRSKDLGYSYSLWIPWDRAGSEGEEKTISLLVKYVPKKGSAIQSNLAKGYLPGKESEPMFANSERYDYDGPISQATYDPNRGPNRYDDRLPEGYRDWVKTTEPRFGKDWTKNLEEREIMSGTNRTQMMTTTIPLRSSHQLAAAARNEPVPQLPPQPQSQSQFAQENYRNNIPEYQSPYPNPQPTYGQERYSRAPNSTPGGNY